MLDDLQAWLVNGTFRLLLSLSIVEKVLGFQIYLDAHCVFKRGADLISKLRTLVFLQKLQRLRKIVL